MEAEMQLDIVDCFHDSPLLRSEMARAEADNEHFCERLAKVSALVKRAVESERAAVQAFRAFSDELIRAALESQPQISERQSQTNLSKLTEVIRATATHREQLVADLETEVLAPMGTFSHELSESKRTRAKFDADFQEYEGDLSRYCGASKKKQSRSSDEPLVSALKSSRRTFHATSLNYCLLLNQLTAEKKFHFIENTFSLVQALSKYFNSSERVIDSAAPNMKELLGSIKETKTFYAHQRKSDQSRVTVLLGEDSQAFAKSLEAHQYLGALKREGSAESHLSVSSSGSKENRQNSEEDLPGPPPPLVEIEGHLFKRSSGARKGWSRRYFRLNLSECRLECLAPKESSLPLQGTMVKEADCDDRRFVFQVMSAAGAHFFQAENEKELTDWVSTLATAAKAGPAGTEFLKVPTKVHPQVTQLRKISDRGSIEALQNFGLGSKIDPVAKHGELSYKAAQGGEWRRAFGLLSIDNKVILLEIDRAEDKIPIISKLIDVIDLNSLGVDSIHSIDESLTGKRNSFCLQQGDRMLFLAPSTNLEKEDWMHRATQKIYTHHFESERLRDALSIAVGVVEARGLVSADFYVEISINGVVMASTTVKPRSNAPYWGEEFHFRDLVRMGPGVLLSIRQPLGTARHPKDPVIGHALVVPEVLDGAGQFEGWVPIVKGPFSKLPSSPEKLEKVDTRQEIRVHIVRRHFDVLPLQLYSRLSEAMDQMPPESFFEITKTSPTLEETSINLLRIYLGKGTAVAWLKKIVEFEIQQTDTINVMFRANSIATKGIDHFMKVAGADYLEQTLGETVRQICEGQRSTEVDPTRLQKNDDINANWTRLNALVTMVWNQISKSVPLIPSEFRAIFSHIQAVAMQRFGNGDPGSSVRYTAVSGFFFLRFFCAAVLTPKLFGLLIEHPDEKTRRTLTLITKTLQSLANLGSFSVKEAFMQPMNEFLTDHVADLMSFLDQASMTVADPDEVPRPVDLAREFAEFADFIWSKREVLETTKSPAVRGLLDEVAKIRGFQEECARLSHATHF